MNKKISLFAILGLMFALSFVSATYYYPMPEYTWPAEQIQPYTQELGTAYSNCIRNASAEYISQIRPVVIANFHNQYSSYDEFAKARDNAVYFKLASYQICRNQYLLWNDNTITRSKCVKSPKLFEYPYTDYPEACEVNFVR